jgi:hypothetical protein
MAVADSLALATGGRQHFLSVFQRGLARLWQELQLVAPAAMGVSQCGHESLQRLATHGPGWISRVGEQALGLRPTPASASPGAAAAASNVSQPLGLVEDATIDLEILASRLHLALMEEAQWEFSDLAARLAHLEGCAHLDGADFILAPNLAKSLVRDWVLEGLTLDDWLLLQPCLHQEFKLLAQEAAHDTNRWLVERQVLPEIVLRPFIRRAPSRVSLDPTVVVAGPMGGASPEALDALCDETRMLTRSVPMAAAHGNLDSDVIEQLNWVVAKQVPEFVKTASMPMPELSQALAEALAAPQAELDIPVHSSAASQTSPSALMEALQQRKRVLKAAAATPTERASIEIVALMFQSIFSEERIPSSIRVWFARLQMPVLRLALVEPDFFATTQHPARRLIDRMGACVMGFDHGVDHGNEVLEKEVKRIVQVIEAFPDTGRRVFITVLGEFEAFLETYFSQHNESTRAGVSLAQQLEQRETLTIQTTIEFRRMLDQVPVHEAVRHFLFKIWAEVVAVSAMKGGVHGQLCMAMKRCAADLVWSSSAKVNREERAEVIRRLPALLRSLREGMQLAGVEAPAQEAAIQALNDALAAGFAAKTAAIDPDRLRGLMVRLETLEELMPDADDIDIDESWVMDLSGQESQALEVVAEGGSMASKAMMDWAAELQIGGWYKLDYRNRLEPVQLAWRGLRKELTLFVSNQGRGILFQKRRLAAFLQAGLLVPAQSESLTVQATRSALNKIDADPSRLLS